MRLSQLCSEVEFITWYYPSDATLCYLWSMWTLSSFTFLLKGQKFKKLKSHQNQTSHFIFPTHGLPTLRWSDDYLCCSLHSLTLDWWKNSFNGIWLLPLLKPINFQSWDFLNRLSFILQVYISKKKKITWNTLQNTLHKVTDFRLSEQHVDTA